MRFLQRLAHRATFGRLGNRHVRECLAVLPVIRTQLQETSQQIEDAVVGVCGNFTGIAARAREAVAKSAELFDGRPSDPDATVESSIETSRRTIASLLGRMERASKLSALAVSSMEEVARTVTGIEQLLGEVQRIAFTNKLVALNAKIEAVHVGQLGIAFEVVAEEISRQAERSSGLADGIDSRIKEMRVTVDSAAGNLRDFLTEDSEKLNQSRHDAEAALNMLWSLHRRTRESLERTTSDNSRLANEIAAAVVGLQFQDRVKQRVGHVVEAIESLESALGGSSPVSPAGAETHKSASDLLHSSYTMEAERAAHDRATAQGSSGPPEMEVELF